MVFYFSGTGNSQLAAKQLAADLDDTLVSINHCLKTGEKAPFHSEHPLVFVAPTYAWRLPRLVEDWIREMEFTGCRDAYFILTRGDGCGNAEAYIRRLCTEKGFQFRGFASVLMPENYLAMFPTPGKAEAQAILSTARPNISSLAARLCTGEPFPKERSFLMGRLLSGLVNPLFYRLFVNDRGFRVSDACISCGLCAKRCPLANISTEEEGRPHWNGNCTHCMACIGGCPTEAIEYKTHSQGRPRYYIMENKEVS